MWFLKRKPKPRLVLHIGTHKTGSTAIQAALRDNRAVLQKARICYPNPERTPFPHLPAHNFIYAASQNGAAAMAEERARIWDEFTASRADCLILSEEALNLPRDEFQDFFDPWRDVFDISIICFLRRQDRYAESLYSQYIRENRAAELGRIDAFLNLPWIAPRFDYAENLRRWDRFGPVHTIDYARLKRTELHLPLLQLAIQGKPLPIPPAPQINVSPRPGTIEIIRHIQLSGLDYRLEPLLEHLRENPPPELAAMLARRGMMGRALRQHFLTSLAPKNQTLKQERGITFPANLPQEPDAPFHLPLPQKLIQDLAAASMTTGTPAQK